MEMNMSSNFLFVQPTLQARYYMMPWLAVSLGGNYHIPVVKAHHWTYSGGTIGNGKTVDTGSLGLFAGLTFGL